MFLFILVHVFSNVFWNSQAQAVLGSLLFAFQLNICLEGHNGCSFQKYKSGCPKLTSGFMNL